MNFGIVVPVGAWTPHLGATLRSLARQTPRPSVALMDASGDARVAELADTFEGLFTLRQHGPDGGQAAAIAEGWAALTNDVLGWLNADDFLAPDTLAHVAAALKETGADAVTGQSLILDEDGAPRGWHPAAIPMGAHIRRGCTVSQPSCFVRRTAIEAVGGLNPDLEFTMDWDLWVRLFDHGATFHHLDAPLSAVIWAQETKTASFGPLRRREIAEIVGRHAGRGVVLKSLIGFGLHHVETYVLPRAVADAGRSARRAIGRPQAQVNGLSEDGWFSGEGAWLPVFHEGDGAKTGLLVRLRPGDDAEATLVTPQGQRTARPDAQGIIHLGAAIPAATMCRLSLQAPESIKARLLGTAWL